MTRLASRQTLPTSITVALAVLPAADAAWPEIPIRLMVTFAANGASDIAEPLDKALGQMVVVDNKPGAGSTIEDIEAVRSAPDGYTLMLPNSTPLSIGPFVVLKLPDDPVKQLADWVPAIKAAKIKP